MKVSSFTIEFPEHLAYKRREYCLFHLRDLGAAVEPSIDHEFVVTCSSQKQLIRVGQFLFHTHVASYTKVIAASGSAQLSADVYRLTT
jgi:hypothetical protein